MPSIDSLANLAYSTIESINGDGDGTSLDFVDEDAFPDPASTGEYNVVVKKDDGSPATDSNAEIMRVTAKSTATFTVTRDQESTTGITVEVGDIVFIAPTIANIKQSLHWEHISGLNASNDATLDIDLDNSFYRHYLLVFSNLVPASDSVELWVRTSTDGGMNFDEGSSDYEWANHGISLNTSPISVNEADESANKLGLTWSGASDIGSEANEYIGGSIWIYDPADTNFTQLLWEFYAENSNGIGVVLHGGGRRLSAADVDAIRLLFSTGNIESGRVDLYGLKVT